MGSDTIKILLGFRTGQVQGLLTLSLDTGLAQLSRSISNHAINALLFDDASISAGAISL